MSIHTDLLDNVSRATRIADTSSKSRFIITPDDRVTIYGQHMRLSQKTSEGYILYPANGEGLSQLYCYEQLSRLNAAGEIDHEKGYYLPEEAKPQPKLNTNSIFDLTEKQLERFSQRYALVKAFLDLQEQKKVLPNDRSIADAMDDICKLADTYMQAKLPNPDDLIRDEEISIEKRRGRQGGNRQAKLAIEVHPTTLRKWVKNHARLGWLGLVDCVHNRGNRYSYFSTEERELLAEKTREFYLHLNRPTKKQTVDDVQRAFAKVNTEREQQGLAQLRVPSRDAVHRCINNFGKFETDVARLGYKEAMKRCKPVQRGIEVYRPLERCEMDEWKIDLRTIISDSQLSPIFSKKELKKLGYYPDKKGKKTRWWLSVIIDCRTRCILAMNLTKSTKAATAIDSLKMAMRDKGAWKDAVGAVSNWDMFGVPEVLATDNGPGYKAQDFTNTCLDLGITHLRTTAETPDLRATVERFFKTSSVNLCSRLYGRTFSSAAERGSHPTDARAVLNTDDLCTALVRWVVDIYHNTPHAELHGRTPLQQWETDMAEGNFPTRALPDLRRQRLNFGSKLTRKVRKKGIAVLGVSYHSKELAKSFSRFGSQKIDVRWLPDNIGSIEALLDGEWHEVPAVYEEFNGVDAQQWVAARRQMKISDPSRKSWDLETVSAAVEAIDAMNLKRSLEFRMVTQDWGPKRMKSLEHELYSSFEVSKAPKAIHANAGQFGETVIPEKPEWLVEPEDVAKFGPPSQLNDTWELDEGDEK
ncbi:DDE-type integrase/transposase/recombinase [Roseovarius sp. EL26]|uniref:DDE-type integrase/transposase/recombinase n=1 Tax=Roseovarius sp. EL26 TaxID=2126672 RepID=UPI000EA3FAA4|nr:DDE-type integrase/transposase/recombinase [Roseovarius sp. EL26]